MSVHVFLPCRKGSERVPKKNIKPFAGIAHGLLELKLTQLLDCSTIDEVVLSTNDEEIIEFASSIQNGKIRIHRRMESLCTSSTSTDDLVAHALDLIPDGHILWTHVTSPFINSLIYANVIQRYFECLDEGYDSLMTTTLIHGFLWNENEPINYDRYHEKWPRTQTIAPIHEVNSGIFLNSSANYSEYNDRIGIHPMLYALDKIVSLDVDWNEDFMIAEAVAGNGLAAL